MQPHPAPNAKSTGWTVQRRARQSAMMRARKIWRKSTGPKTDAGKARSAQNAFKHGRYTADRRAVMEIFRAQQRYVRAVNAYTVKLAYHTIGSTFMKRWRQKLEKQGCAVVIQLLNVLMSLDNFICKNFGENELLNRMEFPPENMGLVHQH